MEDRWGQHTHFRGDEAKCAEGSARCEGGLARISIFQWAKGPNQGGRSR